MYLCSFGNWYFVDFLSVDAFDWGSKWKDGVLASSAEDKVKQHCFKANESTYSLIMVEAGGCLEK